LATSESSQGQISATRPGLATQSNQSTDASAPRADVAPLGIEHEGGLDGLRNATIAGCLHDVHDGRSAKNLPAAARTNDAIALDQKIGIVSVRATTRHAGFDASHRLVGSFARLYLSVQSDVVHRGVLM
jgi:hypothetical protein